MNILKVIYYEYFNDRRKNKFVDREAQAQIAAEILLIVFLFFFLLIFILFVNPLATMFSYHSLDQHQEALLWLMQINSGKWPLIFVVSGLMILASIFFSHRICGPAHKIITMLNLYCRKDLRFPTSVRQYDYLQKVPLPLNQFREMIVKDLLQIRAYVESLEAEIQKNDTQSHENAKKLCGQIGGIVNSYQYPAIKEEKKEQE